MRIRRLKDSLSRRLKVDNSKIFLSLAAIWFSVRVIPKPSRITYPCQKATLSLFLVKLAIVFSACATATMSIVNRKSVKLFSVAVLIGVLLWDPFAGVYYQYRFSSSGVKQLTVSDITYSFPSNRVVRVHSNDATSWDFTTGYYWQSISQSTVDLMVDEGVKSLTSASDPSTAWNEILSTYQSGHKVGIKVNGNDWWNSDQREIDSIPQIVNSVIKGLKSIGVPETSIYIIENTDPDLGYRRIPDYYTSIITALYPSVVFQYNTNANPSFGTVPGTEVSFPYAPATKRINDQIASVDHLILMPIMKAITPVWGITGSIKLMQGVIQDPPSFHGQLERSTADNPNVLIYQNQHIVGKTRLIIGDGLFGAWTGQHFTGGYGGMDILLTPVNDVPKPWATFGNKAPNSLFFAVDPVAVDSVMYDHILRERNAQDQVAGQSLAPFNEPQLIAGAAAGLGTREHGPPYTSINYVEVELGEPPPPPVHDVAVTDVVSSPSSVTKGEFVYVNVTVANQGNSNELFNVTVLANQSAIARQDGVSLSAGSTRVLVFVWNTASAGEGIYTVRAEASIVNGETDLADNARADGMVTVAPLIVHDVAITDVQASPTTAVVGYIVDVTVTSKNEGTQDETFTITVYANATSIGSRSVTLAAGSTTTDVFSWNTTDALGVYIMTASASVVGGESDTADNTRQFEGAVAVFPYEVEFPVASFTIFPTDPLIEQEVTFSGSSSSDPDGTIVSYVWDLGDGHQATGETATHVYSTYGDYTITLTVTDDDGLFDITEQSLIIREQPKALFTFSPATVFVDEVVIFNATLSTPEGGTIVSYYWDFGDGSTTSEYSPLIGHKFSLPETFTVMLNVTDSEGLWNATSMMVSVFKTPTASFEFSPSNPAAGDTVAFDAALSAAYGTSIASYKWDFGDGTQVTENDPAITHKFSEKGDYTVTLVVTDANGLSDSTSVQVSIAEKTLGSTLPVELIVALLGIVLASIIIIVLFVSRRRSKTSPL